MTGRLDRVWRMVGAERLSQLREDGADGDGYDGKIATEFADALRLAHTDLGASTGASARDPA